MHVGYPMGDFKFTGCMVGDGFDDHVREQLPFYDLVTDCVSMIIRNYLPQNGVLYDIGASTGNITKSVESLIISRNATAISVDSSEEMVQTWNGVGDIISGDAGEIEYQSFDVAVCFLTLMFMSVQKRADLLEALQKKKRCGGVIIIVDKILVDGDYFGTVLRRMTLDWKLKNNVSPEQILKKELSLAGVQRPMTKDEIPNGKEFFRLGEFIGWVL